MRRRILVDHPIDPALPVRALDHILAHARPWVAINLPVLIVLIAHTTRTIQSLSTPYPYFHCLSIQTGSSRCDGYFADP